jgi:hypothetical protein
MVLEPIKHVQAELISREVGTQGSSPLLVLADDGKTYFAKTTTTNVPCIEIINELFCAYMAKCWGLKVPDFALVHIDNIVVENYEKENGKLSNRYKPDSFLNKEFFGSEQKVPAIELEKYIGKLNRKSELKQYNSPLDLIKIGVFDLWIGNKDRKPDNLNILVGGSNEKFDFHPIDHAASFAYCQDYKQVTDIFLFMEDRYLILSIPLVRSITNFASNASVKNLKNEILNGMDFTLQSLDFIFEQVPTSWGFSKRAKLHLKNFLSDKVRNERIASRYLSYLK